MSYSYETERQNLFTESGMEILLKIRDNAKRLLDVAGAFTAERAMQNVGGSGWTMLAAFDYMVEKGELVRLSPAGTWGQYQVFTYAHR